MYLLLHLKHGVMNTKLYFITICSLISSLLTFIHFFFHIYNGVDWNSNDDLCVFLFMLMMNNYKD